MRRLALLFLAGFLALGLVPFVAPGAPVAAGERYCPPGVPYCAENAFLDFWKANGGLEILGLPVSQPFVDDRGLIVQFYERAIMEWHPGNEPQYQVLLTLLGSDRLGNRPERTAPAIPCPADGTPCTTFEATGHTLRGVFLQYWQQNGGLPVFGFPLTEEFIEVSPTNGQPYLVQYFERNRFEYHPENQGRFQVLLGLLGFEALQTQRQVLDRPTAQVPDYTKPPVVAAPVGIPAQLTIPSIGVNAPILPVGVDASGNMEAPKTATDVTWYAPGARPGQPGNAAVSGHVDFAGVGRAVFWDLNTLRPGAEVFVRDDGGRTRRFVVTAVETYLANEAPLERIFGATSDVNLNLITCIGNFDPASRSYDKRIVVYTRWDGVQP
jgi:sortase (surface protein transpeptidase)